MESGREGRRIVMMEKYKGEETMMVGKWQKMNETDRDNTKRVDALHIMIIRCLSRKIDKERGEKEKREGRASLWE